MNLPKIQDTNTTPHRHPKLHPLPAEWDRILTGTTNQTSNYSSVHQTLLSSLRSSLAEGSAHSSGENIPAYQYHGSGRGTVLAEHADVAKSSVSQKRYRITLLTSTPITTSDNDKETTVTETIIKATL